MSHDAQRFNAIAAIGNMQNLLNKDDLAELPLDLLDPDPNQPRRDWDTEDMQRKVREMATSIMAMGVVQPIAVWRKPDGRFQIITGETRWRASKEAGKTTIRAVVRRQIDQTLITDEQIIENEVRNNLNPVDLALAVQRRLDEGLEREELMRRYGWSAPRMSKKLSVLRLAPEVQEVAREGLVRDIDTLQALDQLDEGERKIQINALRSHNTDGASVRALVQAKRKKKKTKNVTRGDANIKNLARQLGEHFGTSVTIQHNEKKKSGSLTIKYVSLDTLEGILERFQFKLPRDSEGS
jgi:ParB family chromosome partitioning protein